MSHWAIRFPEKPACSWLLMTRTSDQTVNIVNITDNWILILFPCTSLYVTACYHFSFCWLVCFSFYLASERTDLLALRVETIWITEPGNCHLESSLAGLVRSRARRKQKRLRTKRCSESVSLDQNDPCQRWSMTMRSVCVHSCKRNWGRQLSGRN